MAFDPDAYIKKYSQPSNETSFDPDAYLAKHTPQESSNLKDFAIGAGRGLTLDFGDEALAALEAAPEALTGPEKFADLYRRYQQANQKTIDEAEARSPALTFGGQIAGGLLPAVFSGGAGGAATLGSVAKTGAVMGGLTGIGTSRGTIENNPDQIAKDALLGGTFGGVAGAALHGAGQLASKGFSKGVEALDDFASDYVPLEKISKTIKHGVAGESLFGKPAEEKFRAKATKDVGEFAEELMRGPEKTSREFAQMIADHELTGQPLTSNENLMSFLSKNLSKITDELSSGVNDTIKPTLVKLQKGEPVGLQEIYTLSKALRDKVAPKFMGTPNSTVFKSLQEEIDFAAEKMLDPGKLKEAKLRFDLSRRAPEVLLNKGEKEKPLQAISFSDMVPSEAEKKLKDISRDKLLDRLSENSYEGGKVREMLRNFIQTTKEVEQVAPDLIPNVEKYIPQLEDTAKDIGILRDITGVSLFGPKDLQTSLIGKGVYGSVYTASRGTKIVSDVSKYVFNLPKAGLDQLANTISTVPGETAKAMSNSLRKAVAENNRPQINATLFSIVQNPELRKSIEIMPMEQGQ